MGWLARKPRLAANSVAAVEIVTGEGQLVRTDAEQNEELFWAVRGGGAFGVVTAIEFRLYPVTEAYAGVLFFPANRAGEVLHACASGSRRCPRRSRRSGG